MNIIKLSAISSTNDYLKELLQEGCAENFTVVAAEHQTAGKGQMGARWDAESGKNLTFSVLIKDALPGKEALFNLNVAVSVSIVQALKKFEIPGLYIKWPNDILAGNKKIGGILIENSIKPGGKIHSVIGIGLNVNQKDFEGLPKASSMAVAAGQLFDKDAVMLSILEVLSTNMEAVAYGNIDKLWNTYYSLLFKKGKPAAFEKNGSRFMGIIMGVSPSGYLQIQLEDETIAQFALKEIALLY